MPTYFDLQVNGYGGIDFNQDDLSPQDLQTACDRLAADESGGILATIITDDLAAMAKRLRRLVQLREQLPLAKKLIAGFHIEGPFINETDGYRGAHPRDAVRPATVEAMKSLLDAAGGLVKLVTLAPERDTGMQVTKMLAGRGVAVSAGHTDASLDQLKAAIDAGLTLYTHLGNGCPMQMHRHDNIVQRALSLARQGKITPMFIADGVHVPFETLANYLAAVGPERCIVVTDAIAPAGLGPGRYKFARWELLIEEDMVARAPDRSHFVGSAITMPQTARHLLTKLNLSVDIIHKMTYENPRQAIL